MIDEALQPTGCPNCGRPVQQTPHKRRKVYCNDVCQQLAYRKRKAEKARQAQEAVIRTRWSGYLPETQQVLRDILQLHGEELAERVNIAINAEAGRQVNNQRETIWQLETRVAQLVGLNNAFDNVIAGLEKQNTALEEELTRCHEEIATLKRSDWASKPGPRKRKQIETSLPLPADLVYWRQFANLHGVSQNEVTEAVRRGYIHLQRGSWKLGNDYITQALDTQGQHEFWVQFHASDKFRACDTCPH